MGALNSKSRRANPFAIPEFADTEHDSSRYKRRVRGHATITLAEILYGIEILPLGKRRDSLKSDAEAMFTEDYSERVLVFDEHAARAFAQIASSRRRLGRPIAELDAQIAAIAHIHDAVLATRNTGDFEGCGIRLINPWVD
jgi:toxin FitB